MEAVLLPRAPLIGQTLRSLEFKERYGLQVLALHRAGRVPKTISTARLRMGDVLLLQGTPENVKALERGNLFNIFGGVERRGSIARVRRWPRRFLWRRSLPRPSSLRRSPWR